MKTNESQTLERILESAVVVSWADLMRGAQTGLVHIEYGFAAGGTLAQIYVSTESRTGGNTFDRYVLRLTKKYGRPDRVEIGQKRSDLAEDLSVESLRWSKGEQYIKARRDEHAFTIGSESLDVEMDKLEETNQF
jgi:hypothetical protein